MAALGPDIGTLSTVGAAGRGPRPASVGTPKPGVAVLALNAGLLAMIGPSARGYVFLLAGIPLTTAACIVAWLAARRRVAERTLSSTYFLLSAAAGVAFVVASPAGAPRWYAILYRCYPAISVVAVGVAAGGTATQRDRAVLTVAIATAVLYVLTPFATPAPRIDVWAWIQATAHALLRHTHPYTVTGIDSYGGAFDYGSTPKVFPYMPATFLLAVPAVVLFDDYRFALALCVPIAIGLVNAAAKKLDADPDITAAATLALALHPRGALMVSLGFPDFLLIATAAFFLYCVASRRRVLEAIAFLMLPAIKQYVAAPALLYAAARRRHPAALSTGILVAFATILPFLIWNAEATLEGVLYLVRAPIAFRADSTSLTALVALATGLTSPRWLGIAAQFVAAGIAWMLLHDRGPAGLLLASAISLMVCFLLATQAFLNYYAFVAALFAFAAVAFSSRLAVTWP